MIICIKTKLLYRKLTDLTPLLEQLALCTKIKSLSLANNKLTSLPKNLSAFKSLERLNLRNNPLSISLASESLILLPNLKELNINLKTHEEALTIINSLPHLRILNGEKVDIMTDGEELEEEESEFNKIPVLHELTDVVKIYETITRAIKPPKTKDDLNLPLLFQNQLKMVVEELNDKLEKSVSDDIRKAMILKAKHVLVSFALGKMIDIYSKNKVNNIWKAINGVYEEIFESFAMLLIEIISSKQVIIPKTNDHIGAITELRVNTNDELLMRIASLEEENRRYIDKILKHHKNIVSTSFIVNESISIVSEKTENNYNKLNDTTYKTLPLQQLKDLIDDIYNQKENYNNTHKQHRMTMEEYLYIYFKKKHKRKSLVIEQMNILIASIRKYAKEDIDITLFGKILQNRCDEDYRLVHNEVKMTIKKILSVNLKKKNIEDIEEDVWKIILKEMYNTIDSNDLLVKLKEKALIKGNSSNILPFKHFLKVVLDFQLAKHEEYLSKFLSLFRKIDKELTGVIDDKALQTLIKEMKLGLSDIDIRTLQKRIDPYNSKRVNFSDCVTFFTSEMLKTDDENTIMDLFNSVDKY